MIASISHDIKTPLTSVLGYSERLLTAELSPEKQQQYLNSIHDKAISLKSIVDEFDDYLAVGLRGGAPLERFARRSGRNTKPSLRMHMLHCRFYAAAPMRRFYATWRICAATSAT